MKTGEIILISADGKSVVLRTEDLRPQTQKRALLNHKKLDKRLTKGEKRNSKRMATVASVYTIAPFIRTPEQIIDPEKFCVDKRPKPENKRVWASLVKEPELFISDAFDEALYRDPNKQKHWVALVDGNKIQLNLLKNFSRQHHINLTIVLDIIHIIQYAWVKQIYLLRQQGEQGRQRKQGEKKSLTELYCSLGLMQRLYIASTYTELTQVSQRRRKLKLVVGTKSAN